MSVKLCKCTHTKADHKGKLISTVCHNCPCTGFVPRKVNPLGLIYGVSMIGTILFIIVFMEWAALELGRDTLSDLINEALGSLFLLYILSFFVLLNTFTFITEYFSESRRKDYNE